MPFKIISTGRNKFMLQRIEDKSFVNKVFNSKEAVISAGLNYMAYRGEDGYYAPPDKILVRKRRDEKTGDPKYSKAPRTRFSTGGLKGAKRGSRDLRFKKKKKKKSRL